MTPAELAELRRIEQAATPGPWGVEYDGPDGACVRTEQPETDMPHLSKEKHVACYCFNGQLENPEADATFIAAARNALPALLDEVERLQAIVRDLAKHDPGEGGLEGEPMYCRFCNGAPTGDWNNLDNQYIHAESCPWRRAREVMR